MDEKLIVIDNSLVRASYRLSLNEIRLIYCAISKMPKNGTVDPKTAYYITKQDFIEMGVESKNVAREIRSACSDLMKRTITIKTPIGDLETHWLHHVLRFKPESLESLKQRHAEGSNQYMHYLKHLDWVDRTFPDANNIDNLMVMMVFHEDIIPYITELKSQFTQYFLSDCTNFSGVYSYRLYQVMMQFKTTGYVKLPLSEIRLMLSLDGMYPKTADLKRRVIDSACDEINKQSPYSVKHKLIKTGKKFTHLEIIFKKKNIQKAPLKCPHTLEMFEDAPQDEFVKLSDAQLDMFSSKLSELGEVQNMANVGEDMNPFIARLRSMLKDAEKQKILRPYLKEVGFKATQ